MRPFSIAAARRIRACNGSPCSTNTFGTRKPRLRAPNWTRAASIDDRWSRRSVLTRPRCIAGAASGPEAVVYALAVAFAGRASASACFAQSWIGLGYTSISTRCLRATWFCWPSTTSRMTPAERSVHLHEGLAIDIYMDDEDSTGQPAPLIASGLVEATAGRNWAPHVRWCCRITSPGIQHLSTAHA